MFSQMQILLHLNHVDINFVKNALENGSKNPVHVQIVKKMEKNYIFSVQKMEDIWQKE